MLGRSDDARSVGEGEHSLAVLELAFEVAQGLMFRQRIKRASADRPVRRLRPGNDVPNLLHGTTCTCLAWNWRTRAKRGWS